MSINTLLAIALGGALGAVGRYIIVYLVVGAATPGKLAWGTIAVNLVGSFVFGLLFVLFQQKLLQDDTLRLALMVGFLGAFTTFSTFSFDAVQLLQQGHFASVTAYVFTSVFGCIAACWLGMQLVR